MAEGCQPPAARHSQILHHVRQAPLTAAVRSWRDHGRSGALYFTLVGQSLIRLERELPTSPTAALHQLNTPLGSRGHLTEVHHSRMWPEHPHRQQITKVGSPLLGPPTVPSDTPMPSPHAQSQILANPKAISVYYIKIEARMGPNVAEGGR
ncbi:hypothetical protein CRENBAI_016371 [Crenichthys baileyi]|uniref:Uncharacterized protein n=1 Tax=Crenichthys baileyi TaxID=28760 RepID=A0AAV9R7N0_9TELE